MQVGAITSANAQKATTAQSYLLTGAASGNDGKVKVELGDDPDRTGSYQFTFTVYNLSQEPKTYAFGSDVLTEAVETLDGVDYMAETSHGLSPKVDFAVAYPAPRNQALGSPGMLACTVHTRAVEGRAPPRQSKGATGFL